MIEPTAHVEVLTPGTGPVFPRRDTELDDEIEQILGQFIADPIDRVRARNEVCAAIAARGYDVYAKPSV
jgi:hypothetical protein